MPDFSLERGLGGMVCGIDEAGRGPLAGPVVAAAAILPPDLPADLAAAIDDSKKLKPARRAELAARLKATARFGIGLADVAEIDALNVLQATLLAMRRAYHGLGRAADHALIDGNKAPVLPCRTRCVIGGDGKSLSIAAASILAKEHRDALMRDLARAHPGYGWERNAGYGTAQHLAALRRLGATAQHRKSFAPVAEALGISR
jgi:ribonuclease HII